MPKCALAIPGKRVEKTMINRQKDNLFILKSSWIFILEITVLNSKSY